jgi:hypothetical protein
VYALRLKNVGGEDLTKPLKVFINNNEEKKKKKKRKRREELKFLFFFLSFFFYIEIFESNKSEPPDLLSVAKKSTKLTPSLAP